MRGLSYPEGPRFFCPPQVRAGIIYGNDVYGRSCMKKARWALAALVLVMALVAGCAGNPVQENMAAFDRAYIPALILTTDKDTSGQSVMAIKQLKLQWSVFKSRNPDMAEEGGAAHDVTSLIMKADSQINVGRYREAHHTLARIRLILLEARAESRIKYFPDRLVEFHVVLERIEGASGDPERLQRHMPDAIAAWERVQKARFSRATFRLSKDRAERLKNLIEKEADALGALLAAAASDDRKKVAELVEDVSDRFNSIYSMFGNFSGASL